MGIYARLDVSFHFKLMFVGRAHLYDYIKTLIKEHAEGTCFHVFIHCFSCTPKRPFLLVSFLPPGFYAYASRYEYMLIFSFSYAKLSTLLHLDFSLLNTMFYQSYHVSKKIILVPFLHQIYCADLALPFFFLNPLCHYKQCFRCHFIYREVNPK
jgi:hypothetical protein